MIAKGEDWGRPGLLPADAAVARSDRDLAAMIAAGSPQPIALAGGDLCRTLGGRGTVETRRGTVTTLVDIDVGTASADGVELGLFVAHLVARGRLWHGPTAVVMNAQWMGEWDVAPRAHPGDGRFDLIQGQLPLRQRVEARRRAPGGGHLPHPRLRTSSGAEFVLGFDRARKIFLDGREVGRHRSITVGAVAQRVTVAV